VPREIIVVRAFHCNLLECFLFKPHRQSTTTLV
jgi:hypothetical protein